METATIRSYNNDIEKLQKDLEIMQKQNECLRRELSVAKDQIVDMEKTTLETKNNYNLQHLTERIKFLEEREHQLQAECNDLREQNELLEFRILELEEANDKFSVKILMFTQLNNIKVLFTYVKNEIKNFWRNKAFFQLLNSKTSRVEKKHLGKYLENWCPGTFSSSVLIYLYFLLVNNE
uniref:Janus kinase and microtubule-interacting protein C-terminal domain-containing protein n=1 Tax=Glossina austeni TaxID=7395 RepID=A0A1A9UN26_GLOAU